MISTKKLSYKICQKIASINTSITALETLTPKLGIVEVSGSNISSLPATILNADVLADHICLNAVLSNPSAQTADWTVTTSAGQVVISGTSAISGTTDVTLYLGYKKN